MCHSNLQRDCIFYTKIDSVSFCKQIRIKKINNISHFNGINEQSEFMILSWRSLAIKRFNERENYQQKIYKCCILLLISRPKVDFIVNTGL